MAKSKKYKYMSANEIAGFLIYARNNNKYVFDMEQSFKIGKLTDGEYVFDASDMYNLSDKDRYFRNDFFYSLNDTSPEAKQFKEQASLLAKFYRPEFYTSPNADAELTAFLKSGIKIISDPEMRFTFLRGMYAVAFKVEPLRAKIAVVLANSPFAEYSEISAMIANCAAELKDDEMKQWLDKLEKSAVAEIMSEFRDFVPNYSWINIVIGHVNYLCDLIIETGHNLTKECAAIKNRITVDNMIKMGLENLPMKSEDPKDKEIARLNKIVKILQADLEDARKQKEEEQEGLRVRDAAAQKHLKQASTKLKADIGSRGVKNVKKQVSDMAVQVKHK